MRGIDERSGALFSYVDLKARVPTGHPLRAIREIANAALGDLSRAFAGLYTPLGRPSIPPEELTPTAIRLVGQSANDLTHLGLIDPKGGVAWFDAMVTAAQKMGRRENALRYYQQLVRLITDEELRNKKLNPGTKSGAARASKQSQP